LIFLVWVRFYSKFFETESVGENKGREEKVHSCNFSSVSRFEEKPWNFHPAPHKSLALPWAWGG
jgi:hypothetical protein